jgi:hypothetical protein
MLEPVAELSPPSYRDFIKEAFIDPIRTAVVVDDEYPTLDELLLDSEEQAKQSEADKPRYAKKNENRPNVREILKFCRAQEPTPWLVDVHDGRTPTVEGEKASVSHLESSDLLILDYHLEATNGSEKAIEILRRLAANGHFNLVVVYTKDRDPSGVGIERTINEIALSLAFPSTTFDLKPAKVNAFEVMLDSWEGIDEGISSRLLDSIDEAAFLKVLEYDISTWESVKRIPELAGFASYVDSIPAEVSIKPDQLLALIMNKRQVEFRPKMSTVPLGQVTSGRKPDQVNWIRVESVFVTVVSKDNKPESIPKKLLDALEAWDPVPHRLIMSKMRNELAVKGVMAESKVLMNRHLQAGWLAEVLEPEDSKRRTTVRQNVARHWESLGGKLEVEILNFAERVATYLAREKNREDLFSRFDKSSAFKQKSDVHMQMNAYACSKPIESHHLSTGHVLRIGDGKSQCQYWLCLTPACDLEPGQGSGKGWGKRLGAWLPFKAVRLYPAHPPAALKDATRGYHLFLNENGKITAYGFAELTGNNLTPTLSWEQFFAENQGNFKESNAIEVAIIGKGGALEIDKKQAVVVAQLRYEYALNLMHRLGSHLSRVGLDFSSYSDVELAIEDTKAQ